MSSQVPKDPLPGATRRHLPDQLLVRLRTTSAVALGREATEAARASALGDELVQAAPKMVEGWPDAARGPAGSAAEAASVLSHLERVGAIVRTVPVRRPGRDAVVLSDRLPTGAGQAAAAAVESFSRLSERPSDRLLEGTVIVRTRDAGELEAVRLELLRRDDQIASVERIAARRLVQDPSQPALPTLHPWHLDLIGTRATRLSSGYNDASGVRVAVLDTGIDADHPLLAPAIDGYSYDPPFPGISSGRRDRIAHGTHVAGTIAAHGGDGNVDGVCRGRLHVFKIFDDEVASTTQFSSADGRILLRDDHFVNPVMYLRALASCIDNNFDVVNLSIGGPAIGDSQEQALFRRLGEQKQIIIAAMGNERRDGSPTSWPAAYPEVIAVGAIDANDRVAGFSSSGGHIEVCAPGVDILATMPTYQGAEHWTGRVAADGTLIRDAEVHWTTYRAAMSGTSMAAPQVAAAAALWVARHGRDPDAFRQALRRSSRRLPAMGSAPDEDHGHGCLDLGHLLS